ncbi:hypothetical protein FGRMN_1879 [Fusarium graminum]|nr:hypothetical protein FGRMN_1879 [Fusarium graminum]
MTSRRSLDKQRQDVYPSTPFDEVDEVLKTPPIARDYSGAHEKIDLLLTRFFLGITEAPYYPGALYILARFYTRKELATRISILYTGNILATAFAGLIALGIFEMDGMANMAGWQWLFIIQGAVTLVIAIGGFFILPDEPLTTHWLTTEE